MRACLDCPVTRRQWLDALVPDAVTPCAFECISVPQRDPLPERWFTRPGLAIVRRGVVIRQRLDVQGRVVPTDVIGMGGAFPLDGRPDTTAGSVVSGYAATSASVCLIDAPAFAGSYDSPIDAVRDLMRLQAEAIDRVERFAESRGRGSVASRLAALLCTLADTLTPPETCLRLPAGIQQRDLALLIGARFESVCRALAVLEDRGAVRRKATGTRILDFELLQTL